MRIDKTKVVCLLMGSLMAGLSQGAPRITQAWQTIATRDAERVELDKARVGRMPNGQTAAWTRLWLGFEIPDSNTGARYAAIEALNSYDCSKREFSTLKRRYVATDGTTVVREEKVSSPRVIEIEAGSFEDKLLAQVCKPRSVGQMKDIAETAALAMTPPEPKAETKPGLMSADMRSEEKAAKKAPLQVADASKPAPAPQAPLPMAEVPSKPRMIELPKIDKSQVEDPYRDSRQEKSVADAKKAAPVPTPPALPPSNVSRAEIERQLATFGPRKPKPKKKPAAAKPAAEEVPHLHHWSYEGEGGPQNWAKLSPANTACAMGKRQSPIDIREGIKVDLEPIKFSYGNSTFSVIDNGHTVQVSVPEGHFIRVMERNYQLLQFHFHKPAEERVNGRTYDMVAHLVHKDDDGRLAVIAVLVEKGQEHPVIQTVWNHLPLEQGMLVSPSARIDLNKLLPENRAYWTYMGSLTTPPCTEDVMWMVFKQPIQLSQEQVSIFGRLYRNNARPVQAANGRLIKESR